MKDIFFTSGVPTSCGSQMMADWVSEPDGSAVRRLIETGAVIIGKINLTEFAFRAHHPYRPAPVNPWCADRWSGGSSSGSGVAAIAGLCYAALGTDTGGSIRFPAPRAGLSGSSPRTDV